MRTRFMDGTSLSSSISKFPLLTGNRDVTRLHRSNADHLSQINPNLSPADRDRILEEVYVLAETEWIHDQPNVKKAISDRGLQIHAFVYDKVENRCIRLVESKMVNGTK